MINDTLNTIVSNRIIYGIIFSLSYNFKMIYRYNNKLFEDLWIITVYFLIHYY